MESDWARTQKHLLDLILENLESAVDYLRFGAVCLQWNSVIKDNQAKRIKTLHHQYRYHQVPMLLTPGEDENTWNIYNVMDSKFLESELLMPYGKRFCGSSKGWLVAVNKDWTVTLYKPFSMVKDGNNAETNYIHLPCLFPIEFENLDLDLEPEDVQNDIEVFPPELKNSDQENSEIDVDLENIYDYHVYKALITADPVANPNECTIIVIFNDLNELAFIRLAQDTTWIKIETTEYFNSHEVLHYNDLFYVVTQEGILRSFDVTDAHINSTIKSLAPEVPQIRFRQGIFEFEFINRYLVESFGQILQVERYLDCSGAEISPRITKLVRVWRFDFDLKNWIEIENLGGMALFLGDNSSVSVLASNFSGIQPNCIYFTHDVDQVFHFTRPMISDLGMYDLENRNYKLHFTIDSVALQKMNTRPPIWILPTI